MSATTVTVKIFDGRYWPCNHCKYNNVCIVPNNHKLSYVNKYPPKKTIELFQCQDYIYTQFH